MGLEDVINCPICETSSFIHILTGKDYTTTGELFHVKQCQSCSLLITSPRPTVETAARYYESKQYISHTSSSSGLFDSIYLIIRRFTLKWKYSLIKPYLQGGPILDFGCGTGNFLQEAMRNKHVVQGVEPSAEARSKMPSEIPVVPSLDVLPPLKYDAITLWHVLEHVYTLRETLRQLKSRLTDCGTIFIAVPNWESYDANHYKEQWAAYDVPRHLWHFSKASMETLIQREGFSIRKIIPMKLDAYYVSMLSEKNSQGGRLTLARTLVAIGVAAISNSRGRSQNNQSSLIYVVQK